MKNEDLVLDRNYKKGDEGKKVKLIQEWLCLHNILVTIDGDFGSVTQAAVKVFQSFCNNLECDGIVGSQTFKCLVQPMKEVTKSFERVPPVNYASISKRITNYAFRHLIQHPREVGGQNRGPWVRLYMRGEDGTNYPWCCGFVCYILKQAYGKEKLPVIETFNVDLMVKDAIKKGMFLTGNVNYPVLDFKKSLIPGDFFVCRKVYGDWTHIGIIVEIMEDYFTTIEGNTNDAGEREGYEVCKRIRGYRKKDFILIGRK